MEKILYLSQREIIMSYDYLYDFRNYLMYGFVLQQN